MMNPAPRRPLLPGWLVLSLAMLAALGLGLLASSINQRRVEARLVRVQFMQPLEAEEANPERWSRSFPRQALAWESSRDPAGAPAFLYEQVRDYLVERPRLAVLWAGFPFARAWKWPRSHVHSVEDVVGTSRIDEETPAACWACKSSDAPRLMTRDGLSAFYAQDFEHHKSEATNPIACLDCHDPQTMELRISRPALKEALQRQGRDPEKASLQEKRSLVCAQCHVEYYFKGKLENHLTHPWDEGLTPEAFEEFYARAGHVDWIHPISGARMLKMQHPDYELSQQGPHARAGISCTDCHMPYVTEGSARVTDHSMPPPSRNLLAACQVCHPWSEAELHDSIVRPQRATRLAREQAEKALVAAHLEVGDAARHGATDAELEEVRALLTRAQLSWDYVASANSQGFHAPEEALRILGRSLDLAGQCRQRTREIRTALGRQEPVPIPDLPTKAEAQAFIKPYEEAARAKAP